MFAGRLSLAAFPVLALVASCAFGPPPPTPTITPGSSEVRLLGDFPLDGASAISSVLAVESGGFVAAGSAFDPDTACLPDTYQGRLWTSVDGIAWTAVPAALFEQSRPLQLFEFGDALYILGVTGAGDDISGCTNVPEQPGVNFWRSADSGATWQLMPPTPALAAEWVSAVDVVGEQVIAIGWTLGDENTSDRAAVWRSTDLLTWTAAELTPDTPSLAAVAGREDIVVSFGVDEEFPLAWVSRDGGRTWHEESIDVEGAGEDGVSGQVDNVIAGGPGFVGVGSGCCLGVGQLVPIVYTSVDGTQWQGQPQPSDGAETMRRVVSTPSGLLAVGIETYVTDEPDTSRLGGRTWLSDDAVEWRRGPDLPELGDGDISAVAAGSAGVVIAGAANVDLVDPADIDTGVRVWFVPFGVLTDIGSN